MNVFSRLKSYYFILLVLVLQVATYFVVYLNIPFARMVFCFIYLLFVPGIVVLKVLSLKNLDFIEKVLFSVSLSVAFLMLIGVVLNQVGKLVVTDPLTTNTILLTINTALLATALIGYRNSTSESTQIPSRKLVNQGLLILLSISLLILGSYGIFVVNYSGSSFFLLVLIILISAIVPLAVVRGKNVPSYVYPFLLLIVFLCALLFVSSSYSLVTPYIIGNGDQWHEYYVFKLTGSFWDSSLPYFSPYYSMISITILPRIFSAVTSIESSFLFKVLYPIVAAFVAIGAYKLYETQTDKKTAFLATFFLIAVSIGKGMGPARQQIAELFYVLLFIILLKQDMSPVKKNVLLIVFGVGLVLSHYSLTYIFLLTLLLSCALFIVLNYGKTGRISLSQFKIPLVFVMLFSIFTFSWYVYVNGSAAFTPLVQTITTVTANLNRFFDISSRGTALVGLGVVETPSLAYLISSGLFLLTELLVVLGFVIMVSGRGKYFSKFSFEYRIFVILNVAIIGINLLLPRIADTFLMQRFYQITLILLAPLAVISGKAILGFLLKRRFQKYYVAILALLIFSPLFLFQTNFVYEVTGDQSYNISLSMHRWNATEVYGVSADAQEVFAAQWVSNYSGMSNTMLYSDYVSINQVLRAYGPAYGYDISEFAFMPTITSLVMVYVPDVDVVQTGVLFNATEILPIIEGQNVVYSNGQSQVYRFSSP